MNRERGFIELTGDTSVEVRVRLIGNLGPRLHPECGAIRELMRLSARLLDKDDRHRDMARLRLHDTLKGVALGVGGSVLLQVQDDPRTPRGSLGGVNWDDGVGALAVGRPECGVFGARAT